MPRVQNTMTVGGAEKAAAEKAPAAETSVVGPAATQHEAATEEHLAARKADEQAEAMPVEAAEEKKEDEKLDREQDQRLDAAHQESQTKGEETERSFADEMDAILVRREELEESAAAEDAGQARGTDERVDEARDADQSEGQRRGEERVAGERVDLDRDEIRDEQVANEQEVGKQGAAMLEEQQEASTAAAEENRRRQADGSEERAAAEAAAEARLAEEKGEETDSDWDREKLQERRAAEDYEHGREVAEAQLREEVRGEWLAELRERQPALAELDDDALERVLAADSLGKARGQLVEELGNVEGAWRAAAMGKGFEHLRGDRIRCENGDELTDGMIVRRLQDEQGEWLELAAIIEAKAGERSAEGLERSSKHPASHREQQRLWAIDQLREELSEEERRRPSEELQARHAERIEELMATHDSRDMGQFRNDLERLMPHAEHADWQRNAELRDAVTIKLDDEDVRVRASLASTEVLAVTPSDVDVRQALERLAEQGIRGEPLQVGMTAAEVTEVARDLLERQGQYAQHETAALAAAREAERRASAGAEEAAVQQQKQGQAHDARESEGWEQRAGPPSQPLAQQNLEEEMNRERQRLARLESLADALHDLDD
jgi:hypothetical protein